MIPDSHMDLLLEGHVAHLATVNPDNTPQVSPIWVDYDGEFVLFNTATGRKKYRNIERNRAVALSITDKSNPYRYLLIQGEVVEKDFDQEKARKHIAMLGIRYYGQEFIPPETEERVILKIKTKHVHISD